MTYRVVCVCVCLSVCLYVLVTLVSCEKTAESIEMSLGGQTRAVGPRNRELDVGIYGCYTGEYD